MDARLVTVAREISSLNANIIRSRLEAEGVQCFVSGEAASSVVGLPANVGAFIDVQVLDFDAARAQSILQEIEEASRDENADEGDEDRTNIQSDFSPSLVRHFSFIWLFCLSAILTGVLSNSWMLGVLAGVLAVCFAVIFQVKNSFKHKR